MFLHIGGLFFKLKYEKIFQWLNDFLCSECPNCKQKGVRFEYEDHFGTERNVYICKYCKTEFV